MRRLDQEDMMTDTILLWHKGTPSGSDGLLHWLCYLRRASDEFFTPSGAGQIGHLARAALGGAFTKMTNVFVAWGEDDPTTVPAAEVEASCRRLFPCTIFCPERTGSHRWISSSFGEPTFFSESSIEGIVTEFAAATFPNWQPRTSGWRPHAVALFHDSSGEELGLVPRHKATPDDIYASVADDSAVRAAGKLWDRATPSTHRDLVAAVLAAQERVGVPVGDRAPLQSGAVDEYLIPLLFRVGRDDEGPLLAHMRRDLHRRYGEFAEVVLLFMLRTYRHGGTEKLLALATGAREAA
jgi:hypothetical protein